MTEKRKDLEELTAHLQQELSVLNEELFAQQKEINILKVEIRHLNNKIKAFEQGGDILNPADDAPPPHY